MRATVSHRYLEDLDIGANQLGMKELASKAIEMIIFDESVPLHSLAVSYNSFRPKHMMAFAHAFQENTTLVRLDLSWNSVGDEGAMILADSLRHNSTLEWLDVTHDDIKEKGCFVIADMLKENMALRTGACEYNRPCAQQYVGKSQSCMVISGRLIVHAPVQWSWAIIPLGSAVGGRCCARSIG